MKCQEGVSSGLLCLVAVGLKTGSGMIVKMKAFMMKKLKLKNMVLAAALAVGLGMTGIAVTAQAAEEVAPRTVYNHNHNKDGESTAVSYDTRDVSIFYHTKYITHIPCCTICGYMFPEDAEVEVVDEPHELVYNYSQDRYECIHCDFWE